MSAWFVFSYFFCPAVAILIVGYGMYRRGYEKGKKVGAAEYGLRQQQQWPEGFMWFEPQAWTDTVPEAQWEVDER